MAQALAASMRDNPNVNKLLDLLNDPAYQAEKQGFTSLINYVDVITEQYNNILTKLSELDERFDKKSPLGGMVDRLKNFVTGIGEKLKAIKDSIVDSIKNTLDAVKDKGLSALGAVSETLHIHEGLEAISKSLGQAAAKCENLEKFHQERVAMRTAAEETHPPAEQGATLSNLLADTRLDFENFTPDELRTVYAKLLDIGMNGNLSAAENACLQDLMEEAESLLPERGETETAQQVETEHDQGEEI